jgi:hypothetical protein
MQPGTRYGKTPTGSYSAATGFTGDFRGIGRTNPWGGKRTRRYRKKAKTNKRRKGKSIKKYVSRSVKRKRL